MIERFVQAICNECVCVCVCVEIAMSSPRGAAHLGYVSFILNHEYN